jgi:hypothetical protein
MNSPVRDQVLVTKLHTKIAEMEDARRPKEIKMTAGSCATTFRGMLQLLRHSGYTIGTAELELDDNSIDAGAKQIKVHVHSEDKITQRIVTIDHGRGMSSLKHQNSWQTAGDPRSDRAEDAIGKFLVGLKGATFSMCKRITIATHEAGGSISCLHGNVDAMYALNSFEPTEFVEDADMPHLVKYFHPTDINTFLSHPSGTMIQMDTFLPEAASRVETTVAELSSSIAAAYPHHADVDIYIQQDDEPETKIEKTDVFYHTRPEAIRFRYDTELRIYEPDRVGEPLRVIEIVKEDRQWCPGGKGGRGIMVAGRAYEHVLVSRGKAIYSGSETIVYPAELEKLKSKLKGILKVHIVQVTDEAYAEEPDTMDNKGFHMRRHIRNVGASMRLGYKFHDRSSHAADRQRMEVTAPPSLDKVMGFTWNKTMRDGPLPQKVVGDALMRIYKQVTFDWTKQTDSELDQKKAAKELESSEDSSVQDSSSDEESHVDIPQPPTTSFFAPNLRATQSLRTPVALPIVPSPPESPTPVSSTAPVLSSPLSTPVSPPPPPSEDPVRALVRDFASRLSGMTLDEHGTALLAYLSAYPNA